METVCDETESPLWLNQKSSHSYSNLLHYRMSKQKSSQKWSDKQNNMRKNRNNPFNGYEEKSPYEAIP